MQAQVSQTFYERVKRQAKRDGQKISELVKQSVADHLHQRELAEK